jgi:predicted RNA-binding Zn-ribbon protein involved in translation (DUF1610 family)
MTILNDIHNILKKLKHRNTTIKYCPKCGSPKLKLSTKWDIWLLPEKYICQNCGYKGPIYLEKEEENTTSHEAKAT